jgi:hypothetical protein
MSILHVIQGGTAAASLRTALVEAGRDEHVVGLLDDLAVGPLRGIDDTPGARATFWQRALGDIVPDWTAELAGERERLASLALGSGQIVIWHAPSVADQLLLRRVAYHLRNAPQRLNEVRLTTADLGAAPPAASPGRADDACATGMFPPERLRAKLPQAAPISVLRISRLALEWQEAKHVNAELRYWVCNTIKSGHYADVDARVLEHASADWTPAARTVGAVIALADRGHLFVSDAVAYWRCRELAAAGRLELRGDDRHTDALRSAALRTAAHAAAAPR